jgi:hypothetical protein
MLPRGKAVRTGRPRERTVSPEELQVAASSGLRANDGAGRRGSMDPRSPPDNPVIVSCAATGSSADPLPHGSLGGLPPGSVGSIGQLGAQHSIGRSGSRRIVGDLKAIFKHGTDHPEGFGPFRSLGRPSRHGEDPDILANGQGSGPTSSLERRRLASGSRIPAVDRDPAGPGELLTIKSENGVEFIRAEASRMDSSDAINRVGVVSPRPLGATAPGSKRHKKVPTAATVSHLYDTDSNDAVEAVWC